MDNARIGIGAVVLNGAVIEEGTQVGAGALVPPGKVWRRGGSSWASRPSRSARCRRTTGGDPRGRPRVPRALARELRGRPGEVVSDGRAAPRDYPADRRRSSIRCLAARASTSGSVRRRSGPRLQCSSPDGLRRDVFPSATASCARRRSTVLNRLPELRAHCHAALNVGATRQEVAEVIFQMVTYGGMPVVVEGLHTLKDVLAGAGRVDRVSDWNPAKYLEFAGPRLQPAVDLLARVPLASPAVVYDLRCSAGRHAAAAGPVAEGRPDRRGRLGGDARGGGQGRARHPLGPGRPRGVAAHRSRRR